MASKSTDVIEGFNAYLKGLEEENEVDYAFSLTLFDTNVIHRDVGIPISKVERLSPASYRPGGNTALNDAIGTTVRKVEADRQAADKVVTVIMTDGEENSSREWSVEGVKKLIEQKEKEDGWTFVFMGASPDAWSQGRSYGVRAGNVAQYNTSQYVDAFQCMAQATNATASRPESDPGGIFASLSRAMLKKAGLRQQEEQKQKS
jgi:uncharacterized protein YegL